jgi:hypothetical protein
MAASPTEKIRELTNAVATLTERLDHSREDTAHLRRQLDEERLLGRNRDKAVSALRQENALLRQRFVDQAKRIEVWANRAWGFFVVLVGALLSLASGLIVTLARK